MPARKSHSKERTARIPAVIKRAQALISDNRCALRLLRKSLQFQLTNVMPEKSQEYLEFLGITYVFSDLLKLN